MAGAIILVIALLGFPIVFGMSMAALAALMGQTLWKDGETRNEGSELIDCNT